MKQIKPMSWNPRFKYTIFILRNATIQILKWSLSTCVVYKTCGSSWTVIVVNATLASLRSGCRSASAAVLWGRSRDLRHNIAAGAGAGTPAVPWWQSGQPTADGRKPVNFFIFYLARIYFLYSRIFRTVKMSLLNTAGRCRYLES